MTNGDEDEDEDEKNDEIDYKRLKVWMSNNIRLHQQKSVDESSFEKITGALTAKQARDTLEKGYNGADRVKQVRLQTLRDTRIIEKILRSLTKNFENVVCAIEESKDLEDLKIEELAGSLEAHEQRKNKKKQESLDEALKTKAKIKDEKESEQRGKHFNPNSRGRGRGRRRGGQGYRLSVECYNCGKHGHFARDCRSAKRIEEKTNLVTEVEESGVLLMAHEESISKIDTMWYLDSGVSNHMSGQKDLFVEMTENGKESMIEDVYYVPAMKSNILSLGQLMKKGYWVLMKNRKLLLKNKEGVIIALVKRCKNRTFKLNLSNVNGKCLKADLSDEEYVWHLRFGHLHFNGLKELTRKNMVYGLPNLEYDGRFCESCIFGKQTRSSFPQKATYEAKELLELIHIDLCGPLSPVSFGNKSLVGLVNSQGR
uniref:CCHC-type domain-containing protein n=1 Tax=Tanacetum cinerariifolium TaxID=118510 RepID=A0A6L2M4K9_TANCI|nr:hypothetical protein [Tanacetum cinerariifolium]